MTPLTVTSTPSISTPSPITIPSNGPLKPSEPKEMTVNCRVRTRIPTRTLGTYHCCLYTNSHDSTQHLALVFGDITSLSLDLPLNADPSSIQSVGMISQHASDKDDKGLGLESVLVRVHSSCFTGETLFSSRCDCADQLEDAMHQISKEGRGVIIYLFQEGRGIGLLDKLKAYNLQDLGHDTIQANILLNHHPDPRTYHAAIAILKDLSINSIRIMTNNLGKIDAIVSGGIRVLERVRILPRHWDDARIKEVSDEKRRDARHEEETMIDSAIHVNGTLNNINTHALGHVTTNGKGLDSSLIHAELDNYLLTKIRKMNHIV